MKTFRRTARNKTIRRGPNESQKGMLIQTFLTILDAIKIYHWKTTSYVQHKATDELHQKLSEDVDRFVEGMLGKSKNRVGMLTNVLKLYDFNKHELKKKLFEFRDFLNDMERIFDKRDTDTLSIRDDMLIRVHQFLYLLSMDK